MPMPDDVESSGRTTLPLPHRGVRSPVSHAIAFAIRAVFQRPESAQIWQLQAKAMDEGQQGLLAFLHTQDGDFSHKLRWRQCIEHSHPEFIACPVWKQLSCPVLTPSSVLDAISDLSKSFDSMSGLVLMSPTSVKACVLFRKSLQCLQPFQDRMLRVNADFVPVDVLAILHACLEAFQEIFELFNISHKLIHSFFQLPTAHLHMMLLRSSLQIAAFSCPRSGFDPLLFTSI
mmetsp:Transcript_7861/g.18789  ORF Transcript_7861/g.18789 Transcript_7861/m.18789 type:complete len:231 (+) Transcript_7861:1526-2218(+)